MVGRGKQTKEGMLCCVGKSGDRTALRCVRRYYGKVASMVPKRGVAERSYGNPCDVK